MRHTNDGPPPFHNTSTTQTKQVSIKKQKTPHSSRPIMDSKEDFERSGSSGDGAGGVIAGGVIAAEYPSDLSEGILPTPPPPPAWTFVTDDDDDATPPPLDIVDPEAVQPPSSAASEAADGASVEETVVIASTTSTGRADVSPADMAGLLPARAALLLDMRDRCRRCRLSSGPSSSSSSSSNGGSRGGVVFPPGSCGYSSTVGRSPPLDVERSPAPQAQR